MVTLGDTTMDEINWKRVGCGIGLGFLGLLGLLFLWNCWTTIPAGHVGVMTTFGAVDDARLPEGFNFVAPWRTIHRLNVRTREEPEDADTPTKDGLTVHLEVSLLYSLKPDKAAAVFQKYGPQYEKVIVIPQLRSVMRNITSHYRAEDLYTANRAKIETEFNESFKEALSDDGILVEGILLRDVRLPDTVRKAIETKLAMDQQAQQMEYTIRKEKLEADRKRAEAQGIADAQRIIQGTLTENYLRYKWIEALHNAAAHNATMIYIPTGHDGLPLVKNIDDKPALPGAKR